MKKKLPQKIKKNNKQGLSYFGKAIILGAVFIGIVIVAYFSKTWNNPIELNAQTSAALKFDPAAVVAPIGSQFDVNVVVDTGGAEVLSTDAYVTFDATKFQAVSAQTGTFFPSMTSSIQNSSLVLRGFVTEPASFRQGTGVLGTITFKVLQSGASTISFYCNAEAGDTSKLIQNGIDAQNIISCSANTVLTIKNVADGTGTITTTPDPSQTVTPTGGCPRPGHNVGKPTPKPKKIGKKDDDGRDNDGKDDDGLDDDGYDDDGKHDICHDGIDDDGIDNDGMDDDGIDDDGVEDVVPTKIASQSAGLSNRLRVPIIAGAALLVAVAALGFKKNNS